jgi:hypothetical protein
MPTITPTTHTPIPPGNCGAQFPSACALGNCSRNSSHPSPSHYGWVEMDGCVDGTDGTRARWDPIGETPRGVRYGLVGVPDEITSVGGTAPLTLSDRWEAACQVCARVGSREVAHIGLYTAKPLSKRIESDQWYSRDNPSDENMFDRFTSTRRRVRGPD